MLDDGQDIPKAIGLAVYDMEVRSAFDRAVYDVEARLAVSRAAYDMEARSAISWALYERRRGKYLRFCTGATLSTKCIDTNKQRIPLCIDGY